MRRHWLLILLTVIFVVVVAMRFADVRQFWQTVRSGHWQWILAALGLQAAYYCLYAGIYQTAFASAGATMPLLPLVPVLLRSVFVNTIAPTLGAGGAALFVSEAARKGHPPAAIAAGTVLVPVIDMTTLNLMLVAGLVQLAWRGEVIGFEIAAAAVLLALNVAFIALLVAGLKRPGFARYLLRLFEHAANALSRRLRRRQALPDGWSYTYSEEFVGAARAVAKHGRRLWLGLAVALLANTAELASLWCLFVGFNAPLSFGALVAGYTIGQVMGLVQVTPQGIGVVEGAMALTYSAMGVDAAAATAATVVFRGLNVGLPTLAGFLLMQQRSLRR